MRTGIYDNNGIEIEVGDILHSEWGYDVIVKQDEEGDYYGALVCEDNHSCKNIPYSIEGVHTIVNKDRR